MPGIAPERCGIVPEHLGIAPELRPLLAVAAAVLDQNGALIEANAGFLRLTAVEDLAPGTHVAQFFIQPDFVTLVHAQAGVNGEIHRGLLTLGDRGTRTRSLIGIVRRVNGRLQVLAEYDVAELEQLYDVMLELNRDYANAQFQLAQANLNLRRREAEIVAMSLTDQLTSVGNRRLLDQAMATEIARAARSGKKLCAFIADLDHFKRVNDTYGHEAGDNVLAAFGSLLRRNTRQTDIVARFGGEEFVMLLPDTDLAEAVIIADRLRETLAAECVEPLPDPVTASFGVAEMTIGETGAAMLQRADKALYRAKQAGRNRVATG
jgi:two-component system, cell cycle response regulator